MVGLETSTVENTVEWLSAKMWRLLARLKNLATGIDSTNSIPIQELTVWAIITMLSNWWYL
jgi:hypothetical protein